MNQDRIETPAVDSVRIVIAFSFVDDRFSHTVSLLDDDQCYSVAASVEHTTEANGASSDCLSTTPAFQQLSIECIEGRNVALLTGMSGTTHWSASFAPDPSATIIDVDVAARMSPREKNEAVNCGSCYLVDNAQVLNTNGDETNWALSVNDRWNITFVPHDDTTQLVTTQLDRSMMAAPVLEQQETPLTFRWRYQIGLDRR